MFGHFIIPKEKGKHELKTQAEESSNTLVDPALDSVIGVDKK